MNSRSATVNNYPAPVVGSGKVWQGGRLIPGRGTSDLQVGYSLDQVKATLGDPDENRSSGDQLFLIYRNLGVDVDFHPNVRTVQRLFFYDAGVDRHIRRSPVSVDGITFQTAKSEVIKRFGQPDSEGGPLRVGRRKESWMYYRKGLQFDFDAKGHVIVISINDPRLNQASLKG